MAKLIEVSVITLVLLCVAVAEGVQLGGACTDPTNCTSSPSSIANSECSGTPKTCKCVATYVAKSDNAKCLLKVNGTCAADEECLENAECSSTLKKCVCKLNFSSNADGTKCSVATGLTTSVILLMAALLVSRFFSALGLENSI